MNVQAPQKLFSDRHLWEIRPLVDASAIAGVLLLAWCVFGLRGVLMPAFTGLFLAYVVEPAVENVNRRWKLPRAVVTAAMLVAGFAAAVFMALRLLPLILGQGYELLRNAPQYIEMAAMKFGIESEDVLSGIQAEPLALLRFLGGVIGLASSAVFWVFLLPFFFFAFSWKFPQFRQKILSLLAVANRDIFIRILARVDRQWGHFFRTRLIVGVLAGFLLAFGWLLTGVPYWFLLGMLGGLVGIVPYLAIIVWIAALIFKYFAGGAGLPSAAAILLPSLAFWGVHLAELWVLSPRIRGYSVNLSSVAMVLAIIVGGAVAGIGGLIFAIPIASALKVALQELFPGRPWTPK